MDHRVLITGASGGIGEQLAHVFAAHHRRLVLVGRNREKLRKVAEDITARTSMRVAIFAQDLTQPDAAEKVKTFCDRSGYSIDTLVNNAGFASFGPFSETHLRTEAEMVELNASTPMKLCRLFLPGMLRQHNGRILNLSSMVAFQAGPSWATYTATKSFVLSFSESLAAECAGTGVTVTALCPGPTDSGFATASGVHNDGVFGLLPHTSTRDVAKYGYRKLMQGKVIAIPGIVNRTLATLGKAVPRALSRPVVAALQKVRKD